MKKTLKSVISLLMAIMLLFSVFTVNVLQVSAAEAGTLVSNAINLTAGQWHSKYWTSQNDDLNCFNKIVVPSRGYITFTAKKPFDSEGEIGAYTLILYKADGSVAWSASTSAQKDSFSEYYVYKVGLNAGTYYMNLDPSFYVYANSSSIESRYKYDFTASNYWEIESNNDKASATQLTIGKTYTGVYTDENYDTSYKDYYKVNLTKGKFYRLTIGNYSGLDSGTSTIIRFYDPNDTNISLYNMPESGKSRFLIFKASYSGWYYLLFENCGYHAGVEYTVTVAEHIKKNQTISGPSEIKLYGYNDVALSKYSFAAKTELEFTENSDILSIWNEKISPSKSGTATVMVKAKETDTYNPATKKVTVKIYPAATSLKSVVNTNKGGLTVSFSTPYSAGESTQIQIATNNTFTKNAKTYTVKKYNDDKEIAGLKVNQTYYVRVRNYEVNGGVKYYSKWSKTLSKKVTVKSPKGSVSKVSSGEAGKLKVTWKSVEGVSGFQIDIATDKKFTKNKKTKKIGYEKYTDSYDYEFTNLIPGKKYYVRLRTYIKVGSVYYYSAWSNLKNKKVTAVPKVGGVSAYSWSKGTLETDWYSSDGVDGYEVQIATNTAFTKNKKSKVIKGNDYLDSEYEFSKLKLGKKYYVRVRAYVKSGKKTYYGSWSNVRNQTVDKD